MKIKSLLAKPFASYIYKGVKKGMLTAVEDQEAILKDLLKTGKLTEFGKEHHFGDIQGHERGLPRGRDDLLGRLGVVDEVRLRCG